MVVMAFSMIVAAGTEVIRKQALHNNQTFIQITSDGNGTVAEKLSVFYLVSFSQLPTLIKYL